MYVVLLSAFLIFLHNVFQNSSCRLLACLLVTLCFLWFVFCVLVPGTLAVHLIYLDQLRLLGSPMYHSLLPHNLYLSVINIQHGHRVY